MLYNLSNYRLLETISFIENEIKTKDKKASTN